MEIFEGNKEVSSAGQIDKLNALRFKMQSEIRIRQEREKRGNFGKMEFRVCGVNSERRSSQ